MNGITRVLSLFLPSGWMHQQGPIGPAMGALSISPSGGGHGVAAHVSQPIGALPIVERRVDQQAAARLSRGISETPNLKDEDQQADCGCLPALFARHVPGWNRLREDMQVEIVRQAVSIQLDFNIKEWKPEMLVALSQAVLRDGNA